MTEDNPEKPLLLAVVHRQRFFESQDPYLSSATCSIPDVEIYPGRIAWRSMDAVELNALRYDVGAKECGSS